MVVSDGKHDLHMLTASCPAGSALPMVGVSYQRSGWEWPRCLGAEAEGHLGAFEQVRMQMKSETSESSSTLPGGPGVVLWSVVKLMKRAQARVGEGWCPTETCILPTRGRSEMIRVPLESP